MKKMKTKWFREAIGYEIYPYSFFDSNNDGFGDLKGIIEKLGYLSELGVNLLWICPIYKSPLDDYGYDVEDYYSVNEILGDNNDLVNLIDSVHQKGMKIILDLVINHVSCEHKWFKEALKDKNSKYHDYFIFRDKPNNWMGFFSESVWTYSKELGEYYFHTFSERMPDLNWSNPQLRQEIYDVAKYYLELGVDGFRLDAIAHLAKDTSFLDSKLSKDLVLDTTKFSNRKEVFDYLKEFKEEVFDHYDCLTIGEVGGEASTEMALEYTKYIDMVFNFDTCWENGAYGSIGKSDEEIKTNLVNLKALFKKWFDACHHKCDMPLYWLNHDHPRVVSQYGSIEYREESAKMLGAVLLFMYGLPFIYQGEELGMSNVTYDRIEDFFEDVSARNLVKNGEYDEQTLLRFLRRCSRISARSPMQWNTKSHAGFSKEHPYIKVNDNYLMVNAEANLSERDSIYNFYKSCIEIRKENNELVYYGSFELIDPNDEDLFTYKKQYKDEELLVIANFSPKLKKIKVDSDYSLLISNQQEDITKLGSFGVCIFKKHIHKC